MFSVCLDEFYEKNKKICCVLFDAKKVVKKRIFSKLVVFVYRLEKCLIFDEILDFFRLNIDVCS